MRSASALACSASRSTPSLPGMSASPAFAIACFAGFFLPIKCITCGGGPMNVMPCALHNARGIEIAVRRAGGPEAHVLAIVEPGRVAIRFGHAEHRHDAELIA